MHAYKIYLENEISVDVFNINEDLQEFINLIGQSMFTTFVDSKISIARDKIIMIEEKTKEVK